MGFFLSRLPIVLISDIQKRRAILVDTLICVLFPIVYIALRRSHISLFVAVAYAPQRIRRARASLQYLGGYWMLSCFVQYTPYIFHFKHVAYHSRPSLWHLLWYVYFTHNFLRISLWAFSSFSSSFYCATRPVQPIFVVEQVSHRWPLFPPDGSGHN